MSTLLNIITGHLDDGTRIKTTPTAMAVTAYLATLHDSADMTLRQLSADVDRDIRSVRRAVNQLAEYGLNIVIDSDRVHYTVDSVTLPVYNDDYVDYEIVTINPECTDQMSLFDSEDSVADDSSIKFTPTPVAMAACKVSKEKKEVKESNNNDCTTLAQPLHNVSTTSAQTIDESAQTIDEVRKSGKSGLAEAMERLAQSMQSNISARDTRGRAGAGACVQGINQELILNQSTNVIDCTKVIPNNIATEKKSVPKFRPSERKKRLEEILERFPTLAEHVAGTLANMMAYGTMPESVFYQALDDAKQKTVRNPGAFLNHKIQEFKKEYRYTKNQ